jgi:ligand-binding sensor domain-containing protein
LNDNSIWDIAVGSDETLWFGTYDNGVYSFDGETWSHYTEEDGLASERITSISVAPDGKIWFATGKGVAQFSDQTFTSFTIPDRVAESNPYKNNVTAVTIAPDGILWVATADGIFQFIP